MTDLPAFRFFSPPFARHRVAPWRTGLALAITFAIMTSLYAAGSGETHDAMIQAGPELTMLLRFMAVFKAITALGLVALTAWRLGQPTAAAAGLLHIASAALMSAAPVLIWQMAHVAAGAVVFHAGLLLVLGTALADRGGTGKALAASPHGRWVPRLSARRDSRG